ncbi:MAG: helix-turn-helix transcriptional regulator [Dehalococcoidia bacterium]|nr:helix-turn-helix transcriptional regulator [Dehalococcoidia bacterium]MYK26111.1 helix-turn-helix transcriptional regulator [Dehalococcoidia bacterium]
MIKNERQYRITKAQAARFAQTLDDLKQRPGHASDIHPRIARAQEEAVESQLADLEGDMREYEELKAGDFQVEALDVVRSLAMLLVKARIARDLTQRELAELVGVKEQQIQRYEATDYASASLSRIRAVVDALLSGPAGEGQRTEN